MDHLECLFERALDAVVGMDTDGSITAWNAAAERTFGWHRDEAIGTSLSDLIVPPQHQEGHARGLDHYNRTGEGPVLERHIHITAMHRDGTEFPVELSIFPMDDASKEQVFYAFVRSRASEEAFRREQELRTREAEAIMKIGQKLIEDISLEAFTQFCLREACEIAGMDAGHLFVSRGRGDAQVLVPSGIWHLSDEQFWPVIDATSSLQFQRGQGLPGRAWLTGEIEALDDLVKDCGFVRREVFAEVGLSRGVALPVHQGDEIHAVLEFFGKNSARVDPEIQRLLKTVGSQIGAAILRKEGAEGRETLRREMMHRVGNSLSILSAIYRNCSRRAASKEDLDEAFLGRITAVGRANRMAIVEGERGVPLSELIMDALGLLPDRDAIELVVSPIVIASEVVMPLSLIFNELGTNALKHGASECGSRLRVKVATCEKSDELIFEWHELRKEPLKARPEQPGRQGFGTQLMRAMIEGRLGGSFERQLDEKGFHFEMRFPRGRLEED